MQKKLVFKVNDNVKFQDGSVLMQPVSMQCEGNTKAGSRCKRRCIVGPYCWTHLEFVQKLKVKNSTGIN